MAKYRLQPVDPAGAASIRVTHSDSLCPCCRALGIRRTDAGSAGERYCGQCKIAWTPGETYLIWEFPSEVEGA